MRSRASNRYVAGVLSITVGAAILSGCGGMASRGSNVKVASTLAASAARLSFGNVSKLKSSSLTDSLTNSGASAVTISSADITGSGFSVSGLSLPMTLSANGSVTFTVTFTPADTGSVNGTLVIVSSAQNSTLTIVLAGAEMAQGKLAISPSSLNFGDVLAGTSESLSATLTASGSPVTVSDASVNSNEFALSGISLPATLADGQTASFSVSFTPATTGTASATLSFASNAENSPATQALTGNGTAPTEHSADLSWDASPGPDVAGYNVYRATDSGGPYVKINTALEASSTYIDSTVNAGQTYFFVTTAVNKSGGESTYSNQAKAVIPTP